MIAIVMVAAVSIPRIAPDHIGDRGIFVSVAERLLAGDKLYSGVWDNKDPLFYYLVAAQRTLGWYAEIAAEALLILIAIAAVYFIALKLTPRWTAAAISAVGAPITLMGTSYYPGLTELPGITLVFVVLAAAAYRWTFAAGVCLALLGFSKLIFAPVAAAGLAGILIAAEDRSAFIRQIAAGAVISVAAIVAVLIIRGELLPFVETIKLNIAYSQGDLIGGNKGIGSIFRHLQLAGGRGTYDKLLALALMNVLVALSLLQEDSDRDRRAISIAAFFTSVVALVVLSMTGVQFHHAQILCIPTIIALLGLSSLLDRAAQRSGVLALATIILTGLLMGGHPLFPPQYAAYTKSRLLESFTIHERVSPETKSIGSLATPGAYARIGQNDDEGHAIGLRDWKLACPRFHQYPFLPEAILNVVLDCASRSPTLLVSASFKAEPGASPQWLNFVAKGEELISRHYSCRSALSDIRVCVRRPG